MVSWSPNFRNINNVTGQCLLLRFRGRSLAIRGWQALGPHRASFAGSNATVDVDVWDMSPDRLQVRLDRRSTTTRHKNLLRNMRSLIKDYSFCLFVLFFVVFHKLLFFNIKPIFVSKCSNRIICVVGWTGCSPPHSQLGWHGPSSLKPIQLWPVPSNEKKESTPTFHESDWLNGRLMTGCLLHGLWKNPYNGIGFHPLSKYPKQPCWTLFSLLRLRLSGWFSSPPRHPGHRKSPAEKWGVKGRALLL